MNHFRQIFATIKAIPKPSLLTVYCTGYIGTGIASTYMDAKDSLNKYKLDKESNKYTRFNTEFEAAYGGAYDYNKSYLRGVILLFWPLLFGAYVIPSIVVKLNSSKTDELK